MNGKYYTKINNINKKIRHYDKNNIDNAVFAYVKEKLGYDYKKFLNFIENDIMKVFEEENFLIDIEFIVEFYESLLCKDDINENGIIFTPKYISDYICNTSLGYNGEYRIIDPSCGCGIFLVSAIEEIHKKTDKSIVDIINNNIFGIDIMRENVMRCKKVLEILALLHNEDSTKIEANIVCADSLKENWSCLFKEKNIRFTHIIGNPPYVNTHDMKKTTIDFLKHTFSTTKSGTFNIFYAFVEYAMQYLKDDGELSYIIPNNFLTIKAAKNLRAFIMNHKYLHSIIDFSDNMVFKPIRTYNCIIRLNKNANENYLYCVIDRTEDIEGALKSINFDISSSSKLDVEGWRLVRREVRNNIEKIENQFLNIKKYIRTGIATLRDNVFLVERDDKGYYKYVDDVRYDIDSELVKEIYKISEIKTNIDIEKIKRYIIFPYIKENGSFKIISEEVLKNKGYNTYSYLLRMKEILDTRDKGKKNSVAWYAYGRSQGLNKYGRKLLFPTFSNVPKFTLVNDEMALFCNGYGVFENEDISLDVLQKILNSKVMEYYVNNTSYPLEGGYYCYQKKYIENFSVPLLTKEEKEKILSMEKTELDKYLIEKYELSF